MKTTIQSPDVRLLAGTPSILQQALVGSAALASCLQVGVPDNWAEERADSLRYALAKLSAAASEQGWWTYLLIYQPDQLLVGSGGYHGAPTATGVVELGYEISEAYRGRGLATVFASELITNAFACPQVKRLIAHTLAETNASTSVLVKNGFVKKADIDDPAEGPLWQWELAPPSNRRR